MTFHPLPLTGAYWIELTPVEDNRGAFTRLMCRNELRAIGHTREFVQVNHSRSAARGTIRGLHFQVPPMAEAKLVTCLKGRVFDVVVDIRKDSPTFLAWHGEELSRSNARMIYLPAGFAHGFQTLEDDVELLYFHTEFYSPEHERCLRFDDPRIGVQWPLAASELSVRDAATKDLLGEFKGIVS